jgi:four helix bundle protein
LDAWKKAHALVLGVYALTASFPSEERYGLTSQLRRAASSVPANIAEGFGRSTTRDFLRHLDIANGSLEETRYFLILARDLRHLSPEDFSRVREQADEVGRLLGGLMQSLRKRLT